MQLQLRWSRALIIAYISLVCVQSNAVIGQTDSRPAQLRDGNSEYSDVIQPLLAAKCVKCHGAEKQKGGLRLDLKSAALKGGDSGEPAVKPNDSAESRLIELISTTDEDERMPPEGESLTPEQIELLKGWVDRGAVWPDADAAPAKRSEMIVTDEDRNHWAFRPRQSVTLPEVTNRGWARTPVDLFVQRVHEEKGLTPSALADARTLIRRLYFDVIGLPPNLHPSGSILREELLDIEIDPKAIAKDPAAIKTLVDQLLASRHYGERWARHWLDVARYADSNGMEGDADRPNAHYFRDFVIRALNDDLSYATFVRWQLAGDEIAPENPDAIAATGFLTAGSSTLLNVPMEEEKLRNRANELDDIVSTTAQAFLGMTLACARCHDHKYDAMPTRDYYRMMSAFNNGDRAEVPLAAPSVVQSVREANETWQREFDTVKKERDSWIAEARRPFERIVLAAKIDALAISDEDKKLLLDRADNPNTKKLRDKFKKELSIEDREYVAHLTSEQQAQWAKLDTAVKIKADQKPAVLPTAFAFADFGPEPRKSWLFERGDFLARNESVSLGFLTVVMRGKDAEEYWATARNSKLRNDSSQQRRAMADWIIDTEHGAGVLLARVMVNRVWQHHFGRGLVATVNDFGVRGDAPTHAELLEWLTGEFIDSGWSLKHLHRLMLNSATYNQQTTFIESNASIDPENRFLWRRRPQRLESEALRDAMLSVAGTLNLEMFGKSFKPPISAEAMQARNVKDPYPKNLEDSNQSRRRSVYMFHKRVVQYPLMQAFDAPDAQCSCGQRVNTTVAPQALALLNDPFVRLRSSEFARRISTQAGPELKAQVQLAFQLGLARQPTPNELSESISFLTEQSDARRERDSKLTAQVCNSLALVDFCQMLFAFNEFIYVD